MAQYTCSGFVKLSGVTFFIEADSLEEAREKAFKGDFESYEGGAVADLHLNTATIREDT